MRALVVLAVAALVAAVALVADWQRRIRSLERKVR